jgi:hypothetical protein
VHRTCRAKWLFTQKGGIVPMDEKSLSDQISNLMNDTPEMDASPGEENTGEQKDILVDNLKAAVGQSDGALDAALDEFLDGKGVLHEATRSALTRGGDSALTEVIKLLTKQFKLSPAVAKMIASLILKLQSSGSGETAKESTSKKKPRRKTKPKTAQKETSSAKKAKKKITAKAKKSTSKTTAKKKTASKTKPRTSTKKTTSKTGKKKAATKPKPKTAKTKKTNTKKPSRTDTVEIQ